MRTESLIFSQLMQNEQYVRKVIPHLKEEYFSSDEDKKFFKIYLRYFAKHNTIPSKQAIRVEIENLKGSKEVYDSLIEVFNNTETFSENTDFLVSETENSLRHWTFYIVRPISSPVIILFPYLRFRSCLTMPR